MDSKQRVCSQNSLTPTKRKKIKDKSKYSDLSCGQEPIEIKILNKERTKLLKKFDYLKKYIVESLIISNKRMEEYLLPSSNSCSCIDNCQGKNCSCISSHCQLYECNDYCSCDSTCENRIIQKGITKKLIVKFINKTKGYGVFADEDIKKGEFICEYIGVIISKDQAERKILLNHKKRKPNYILQVKENYEKVIMTTYIDAEEYGNVGRFINHSCEPNMNFEFIRIKHFIPHVAFFSMKDIKKGEELTFCYSNEVNAINEVNASYQKCECGSKVCKKFIPN